MHYLEKWFKHNGLFLALSTLVAAFSALYSVKLFLLYIVIVVWMCQKRKSMRYMLFLCCWTLATYGYFEMKIVHTNEAPSVPVVLQWTERYKINGDEIRGFMLNTAGEKYYVVYEIASEQEKLQLQHKSLTGLQFIIVKAQWEDVTSNPKPHKYSFSMATYLKSQNAQGTLQISKWQYRQKNTSVFTKLANYRFFLNRHIEQAFPPSLVAEAQALLFGDQQHVDEDVNRAYQKLGITHLFAISGLHVALLSLLLYEVLIRCRVRIQLAQTLVVIALPIYACLAGSAPSVWRSVLLVEILFFARKIKLGVDDALWLALVLSVLWQPTIVLQVGFQLSYLACFSLIYGQAFLQQQTWWQQGFVMTLLCQLLAYPILLFHFYELSLSSFIANIIFVPLFSFVILPINLLLFVTSFLSSSVAIILFRLYEPLRSWLTEFILQLQHIPHQLWIPGKPTIFVMFIMLGFVVLGFIQWDMKRRFLAVLCIIVPAALFSMKHILQSDLMITFVDVGQGDCIVIELPRREAVYVIDSGGLLRFGEKDWRTKNQLYEVGKKVVVPFLKGKGIRKIDAFILTHADADHVEGAEEVLAEIAVAQIHISPNSAHEAAMQDVLQAAAHKRIPIIEKMAGNQWQIGDVTFSYMWPAETHYEGNNDSLVLQLTYEQFRGLFTGDLEEAGELALIKAGMIEQQTVLKAGHHGSKTSSSEAFLNEAMPTLTIFMAGKKNRFNHPNPDVLARFETLGLATMSTKEQETIEIRTDGSSIRVQE